jgi:hypothetical protein
MKQNEGYSNLKAIQTGIPRGSVLGPVLNVVTYIPDFEQVKLGTFTDDTTLLTIGQEGKMRSFLPAFYRKLAIPYTIESKNGKLN